MIVMQRKNLDFSGEIYRYLSLLQQERINTYMAFPNCRICLFSEAYSFFLLLRHKIKYSKRRGSILTAFSLTAEPITIVIGYTNKRLKWRNTMKPTELVLRRKCGCGVAV